MAVARWRPGPGLIHLSDQGSQYISLLFGERCSDADIEVAMGCTSAYDNAIAESFFASLAKDFLRRQLGSRDEARTAVFDYIETLYHPAPTSLNHRLSVVGRLRENERGGTTSRLITRCPPNRGHSMARSGADLRLGEQVLDGANVEPK
jgi:hypothetical protein